MQAKTGKCRVMEEAVYPEEGTFSWRSLQAGGAAQAKLRGRKSKGVWWEGQTVGVYLKRQQKMTQPLVPPEVGREHRPEKHPLRLVGGSYSF